jgi:phosphatidylglycerophosphate synthase
MEVYMNDKFLRLWNTKNKDDEWWSSFVTAPLAILFSYAVADIKGVTPNQITLLSFLTAVLSALFIIAGGSTNFLIAAILIHLSHVFDCMDGQIARYRKTSSASGSYFDRVTDQIQVMIWFGAVGYAASLQSSTVLPVFLSLIGVAFYSLRGYVKYVAIHVEMSRDHSYLEKIAQNVQVNKKGVVAGPGFSVLANLRWFLSEQQKILKFDEGVFIFMLSFSLVLDQLTPMLWVFAASQLFYGVFRIIQRGRNIERNEQILIEK